MPREVFIPFQPEFEQSMLMGEKTATTRTRRFGSPGDWFKQFGAIFILTEVYSLPLSRAIYCHYLEEGFSSPHAFRDFWNKLHPYVLYAQRPSRRVFLHRFNLKHETAVKAKKR